MSGQPSMREVALLGGRWRALEAATIQILQVATTMALARLLTPEDFGLVAVVSVILLLFGIAAELGFGVAIVRRRDADDRYVSSLFWAAFSLGAMLSGAAAFLAAPLTSLAGASEATPLLRAASLTILLSLTASVPRALLMRRFRFATTSAITAAGFGTYAATAVTLAALTSIGAWAIIVGRIASATVRSAGMFLAARWRPRLVFDRAKVLGELGFSSGYLGMRASQYVSRNVDYWFVGSQLGSATLGPYYIAYVIPNLLRRRLTQAVSSTLKPTISAFHEDLPRVRRAYLGSVRLVALAAFPLLVGTATIADLVVSIGFGPGWEEAVRPLEILSLGAAVGALVPAGSATFIALGLPSRNLAVNLAGTAATVGALVISLPEGGLAGASSAVLLGAITIVVTQHLLLRSATGLRSRELGPAVGPALVATSVMAAGVLALRSLLTVTAPIDLGLSASVGAGLYLAMLRIGFPAAARELGRDLAIVAGIRGRSG